MAATALHRRLPWEPAVIALVPAVLATVAVAAIGDPSRVVAVLLGAAVCAWLLLSERHERGLVVLLVYLGLLDGFLRMRTGHAELTLVRDALLWSMALGALLRMVVRREPLRLPPLGGLVLLFAGVVLVQLFNPANGTLAHSLGGVRQHLEFVPLFFLAFMVMRSTRALKVFVVLLLVVGAVNGAVSAVQFVMTPEQLAQWGPGYAERISGTGDVSTRLFVDSRGNRRTRPFGLGSDMGAGGMFGLIALGAGLGLATLAFRRPRWAIPAVVLVGGAVVAIATSQARTVVVASGLAALAFAWLSAGHRGRIAALGGVAVTLALVAAIASMLAAGADVGALDRYRTIAPDKVVQTAIDYRSDDIAMVPGYIADHPLGAGLGYAGPASAQPGKPAGPPLNAEGQANFLVIELGLPGLLAFLALALWTLWIAATRLRRVADGEARILLAAIAAPLFAILVAGLSGITSTSVPAAPYFWFATGVLAYWVGTRTAATART